MWPMISPKSKIDFSCGFHASQGFYYTMECEKPSGISTRKNHHGSVVMVFSIGYLVLEKCMKIHGPTRRNDLKLSKSPGFACVV